MFTLTNVRRAIALSMEANRICLVVFAVVAEEGKGKTEEGRGLFVAPPSRRYPTKIAKAF
ncbi:hypothetical protein [Kamptonema sp. UHCC 0994]|uniref:hypothetical protein n=1 Tax=Kamptonema sp. UHCC 0994 TaxID=3031329 RepID=UPI0023BA1648|nr:hypothetical protein [Kamptonema sp. UHCC 0994]MDF0554418.1 hypothetical protein [Kamptonema sp. UHCC 0994]